MRSAILLLSLALSAGPSLAASDYFLISRGKNDEFIASHKIQKLPRRDYKKLRLCGQDYWVRPFSVAWTKWEEKIGHTIRIEANQGYGWVVLCKQPTQNITLKDVGIYTSLERTMELGEPDREVNNRFQAIRRAFIVQNGMTEEEAEAEIARRYNPNRGSRLQGFIENRDKDQE